MADVQGLKIKLKAGKTDYVVNWINNLTTQTALDEVLKNEGMIIETIFLERTTDADYLILYQRAVSLVSANEYFTKSTHPFDQEVKKFIGETWEEVKPLQLLTDHDGTSGTYLHKSGS